MSKSQLIDAVLEQIVIDLRDGDCTALEELLNQVDEDILRGFLPEAAYEDEDDGQPDELTEWMDFDPDC